MLNGTLLRRFVYVMALIAIVMLGVGAASAQTQLPGRIEILAVHSKTFTGEEFLRGDTTGREALLGGELRLPFNVQGKIPAVVLVHGSSGIDSGSDAWARVLNEAGIAAFILDSFSGRSIVDTIEDQSQLDSIAMMVDAYRALDRLTAHPRIRADRIAVMGFSKGAVASLFSVVDRFKAAYGSTNAFAAHIGMYTPCNTRFIDDTKVSRSPIRLFHGISDDYVSIAPCRNFVSELKAAGADVSLTEYANTYHAFDTPTLPKLYFLPKAQSTRNCRLKEGANGIILNAETLDIFSIKSDSCVSVGAHVGYNPDTTTATRATVTSFLKQVLVN